MRSYILVLIADILPALLTNGFHLFRLVLRSKLLLDLGSFSLHVQEEGGHGFGRCILVMRTLRLLLQLNRSCSGRWGSIGCGWGTKGLVGIAGIAIAILQVQDIVRGNVSATQELLGIMQEPLVDSLGNIDDLGKTGRVLYPRCQCSVKTRVLSHFGR